MANNKKPKKRKKPTKLVDSPELKLAKSTITCPIRDCFVTAELLETGSGFAILSRNLPSGKISISGFRLFLDGSGVQEAIFSILDLEHYQKLIIHIREQFHKNFGKQLRMFSYPDGLSEIVTVTPEYLKKLVTQSVIFAHTQGKKPHEGYAVAIAALSNIEANLCNVEFEFGQYHNKFQAKQHNFINDEQERLDKIKQAAIVPLRQYYAKVFGPSSNI